MVGLIHVERVRLFDVVADALYLPGFDGDQLWLPPSFFDRLPWFDQLHLLHLSGVRERAG
jgi:hypothetical protein